MNARGFTSPAGFLNQPGSSKATDCLVLDIVTGQSSEPELQSQLNARCRSIPTVFITADHSTGIESKTLAAGGVTLLQKPFDAQTFLDAIKRVMGRTPKLAQ